MNQQNLAPSDYHLFSPMKEGVRGKSYATSSMHFLLPDKEVETTLMKWLKEQLTEFYEAGIHVLIQSWNIAIERNSGLC